MGWIGGHAMDLGENGAQNEAQTVIMGGAGIVREGSNQMIAQSQNDKLGNKMKDKDPKGGPKSTVSDTTSTEVAGAGEGSPVDKNK